MISYPMIAVALLPGEERGWVIASLEPATAWCSPERVVVGDVRRQDGDGPLKAWLWPAAGGALHISRSCAAVEAPTSEALAEKLRWRVKKEGIWWG